MKKWRDRLAIQRALEDQRVARFSIRLLKHRFDVWKAKYKKKKQALWREDMRQKMKIVKRKAEIRIKRDAWTKWQRMLLLHRAQRHYEIGLLYRSLGKWQEKIARVKSLEQHADIFLKETDLKVLDRLWHLWTFNTILRHKFQVMARRVENRIIADALDKWKTRM
jgi:protein SFI1